MAGPCSALLGEIVCDSRRQALAAGEMFYSTHLRGWIYPAENRATPKSLRDAHEAPFTWPFCPFCGSVLPAGPASWRKETGEGEE